MSTALKAVTARLEQLEAEIAQTQQEFSETGTLDNPAALSTLIIEREQAVQEILKLQATPPELEETQSNREIAQQLAKSAYEAPEPTPERDTALAGVFATLALVEAVERLTETVKPRHGIQIPEQYTHEEPEQLSTADSAIMADIERPGYDPDDNFFPPYDR